MKKLILLTTVFAFLILFVVPFASAFFIRMIPYADQPAYDINVRRGIFGVNQVSQVFTTQENNLTAIGISLGNPNLKNQSEVDLDLYDQNGSKVRRVVLNGANVPDGALIKFVFDPISDSAGKTYTFVLSSPNAGPETLINIYFSTQKTPWIGSSRYGQEVLENGLPIVTFHKVTSHSQIVKEIFTSWIKRIFG